MQLLKKLGLTIFLGFWIMSSAVFAQEAEPSTTSATPAAAIAPSVTPIVQPEFTGPPEPYFKEVNAMQRHPAESLFSVDSNEPLTLNWSSFSNHKEIFVAIILSLMLVVAFFRLMVGTLFDFIHFIVDIRPSFHVDRVVTILAFGAAMHFFFKSAAIGDEQYQLFMGVSLVSLLLFCLLDYMVYRLSREDKIKAEDRVAKKTK